LYVPPLASRLMHQRASKAPHVRLHCHLILSLLLKSVPTKPHKLVELLVRTGGGTGEVEQFKEHPTYLCAKGRAELEVV